ncbi:hypothetical protein QJ850_gp452 [Acanthamoeba polyphaga mimivirus]|uniref:Uncharacterized protein n=1 Tax=Acanthamoeba polyphaga mimivirus Kroon TaxID=3069720 RepID=A0A0G2Y8T0_9VIRU|nr:hypothetical protein QJ850_gp452 [Acanthamoeba polyphaga mimivirus]AKI80247.1 hypothetical protein [Acanthamoeba polyphaga mimivirus Kroon]
MNYYDDGSTNVKCTLQSFKNTLENNLLLINKLIEESENIINVSCHPNNILLEFNSNNIMNKFINDGTVKIISDNYNDSDDDLIPLVDLSEEETNQDRLNRIINMTNRDNSGGLFGTSDDDEEEISDDDPLLHDLLKNQNNTLSIFNKYTNLIGNVIDDSDNSDDSDDSDNSDNPDDPEDLDDSDNVDNLFVE